MNETTELIMKQLNAKKVHAETHELGGGDEIDVTKLKNVESLETIDHSAKHELGGSDEIDVMNLRNVDNLVTKTGDFSGTWNGITMTSTEPGLSSAFDALKADIATAYASNFKTGSNDWGQAINSAINSIVSGMGKVILPAGDLTYTNPVVMKSNIIIEGQGIDITNLKPVGCHGITVISGQYLRFSGIRDLTITGDNNGDNSTYDSTKNGVNWDTGSIESYQCFIERVRVVRCKGKGVYVPYDFNNVYDSVFVSTCGGNGIEICGLNTSTLRSCYVDYVAPNKVGYRVYQNAVLISCNGTGGGTADYWGVFGRNNGAYEDTNKGQSQYFITLIGCNIEDWNKTGCVFLYSGGFQFIGCTFYAPATGTYDYYIDAQTVAKMSLIDGGTILQSKGATGNFASKMKSNVTNPALLVYSADLTNFTTDGTSGTLTKIPRITSVYDSFLQGALEFDYMNIKGMSYFYLGGKKHSYGTAAPTTGTYAVGDTVHNTAPASGSYAGWKCITAGTPGTWRGFGQCGAIRGNTATRPATANLSSGYWYSDTDLATNGKPIMWNGINWVDGTGTIV